jgi:hypothetical protein
VRLRALVGLFGLAGCIEFGLNPIESAEPDRRVAVTERFVQSPLAQVDILFVVDRTASMAQEHDALIAAADGLALQLQQAGVSWQLGLVDAEMGGDRPGWLLGEPWVWTATSGDLEAHLADVLVTAEPAGLAEAGIAAALEALDLSGPGLPNEGFRRPDAALHVVFLSDGDDASAGLVSDPVGGLIERLDQEAAGTAMASAIVGDDPGGCVSASGSATAGGQYVEVAVATGGSVGSICATDFDPIVADVGSASIVLPTEFTLQNTPVNDNLTVTIDDQVTEDWAIDLEAALLRFTSAPAAGASIAITYLVQVEG